MSEADLMVTRFDKLTDLLTNIVYWLNVCVCVCVSMPFDWGWARMSGVDPLLGLFKPRDAPLKSYQCYSSSIHCSSAYNVIRHQCSTNGATSYTTFQDHLSRIEFGLLNIASIFNRNSLDFGMIKFLHFQFTYVSHKQIRKVYSTMHNYTQLTYNHA